MLTYVVYIVQRSLYKKKIDDYVYVYAHTYVTIKYICVCVCVYNRLKFGFVLQWIKEQYNPEGVGTKDLYYPVLWPQV